jgi:hypothetical protein
MKNIQSLLSLHTKYNVVTALSVLNYSNYPSQPVISQIIGMFDIIYSIAIKFNKKNQPISMEGQESLQVT